ncbi:fumarylacetoacetate hydrolase family protein [Pseudonocardia thermophila]|uniref:fumarylacetoacetate hydrolase family protein n=1 Tax=Pseudonocardia thermophila TaxID=1848 RepID=UPI00248D96C8|nr:fumarylacetoacetate hydrolase family protein [Pseudonocardia thermophila]
MKIVSYRRGSTDSFGVVVDGSPETGHAVDASAMNPEIRSVLDLLRAGAVSRLAEWIEGRDPDVDLAGVALLPPVIGSSKVLCAGVNYAPHRDEASVEQAAHPTIFIRFSDTHVAHGQPLILPSVARNFDFEGELLAVIGRHTYRETPDEAADAVIAYSCYNDGSVRDWQFHSSQWIPSKNFPGTGGFGPWLVTTDETGDIDELELITRLNDDVVQHARIGDLIFSVPELVSYVSQFTPLSPGDLLLTGTPGGVGAFREPPLWLTPGDAVTVEVSGIGRLRNEVAEERRQR